MATLKNTDINDTGYLKLPVGTTAERPVSPQTGYIRYNSTTQIVELYNGTNWVDLTISYLTINGEVYIDNTVLLLQGDNNPTGVTQNNTFIDSSTNNFTITRNGNVTQGTFSPFDKSITNSGGSAYFDGVGDNLQIPNNSNLTLGTGNFTIEFWIYPLSQPGNFNSIIGGNATSEPIVNLRGSGTSSSISMNIFGTADIFNINFTFTQNNWYHVAISRSGTSLKVYVNGNQIGSTITDSTNISAPITSVGGLFNQYVQNFNGYISNLRVVKGTAVYTANFQPSTTPLTAITNTSLLLNFTNAAIFDGVKNNNLETVGNASINTSVFKYGTGSLVFNGNASWVQTPSNTLLNLGSGDFTIEFWIYAPILPSIAAGIITKALYSSGTGYSIILYPGYIAFIQGSTILVQSPASSISTNTWIHIAVTRSGTSGKLFINGTQSGSTGIINNFTDSSTVLAIGALDTSTGWNGNFPYNGYIDDLRITKGIARYTSNFTVPSKLPSLIPNYLINRSLRFSSSRSTYLSRTPTVAGNRRTWTWSGWVKRSRLNGYQYLFSGGISAPWDALIFSNNGTNNLIQVTFTAGVSTGTSTIAEYRDPSAWYHIILSVDTTQATASDRFKLYVNGVQITSFVTTNYPAQYTDTKVNSIVRHTIGAQSRDLDTYFDGYMAEVNFIDGQALTPTSFGELSTTTGTWIPKLYTGTYGTNGFRLKFSDLTQLGEDFSGNLNNWTPNNFTTTPGSNYDLINDTPINADETIGNYATLNPLTPPLSVLGTYSNANLQFTVPTTSGGGLGASYSTIPLIGKIYLEIQIVTYNQPGFEALWTGLGQNNTTSLPSNMIAIARAYSGSGVPNGLLQRTNGVETGISSFTLATTDIFGFAFDSNTGKCWVSRNGTYINSGNPVTEVSPNYTFNMVNGSIWTFVNGRDGNSTTINFGQRPFVYTIPTGFKTLNTYNLPTPTIGATATTQANKFMDISLYTGTGTAQSIFNSGAFQPDLVWIKNRTGTASNHALYDSVRGVTKQLSSNTTDAETTETNGLTVFNSNGFTIGTLGQINTSGSNYIAWQWKSSNTTVVNTVGTITSTVSVNTTVGFSIVRYTGNGTSGATVGHGLGVSPSMIIIKNRDSVLGTWMVAHSSLLSGYNLNLNDTVQQLNTFSRGMVTAYNSNSFTLTAGSAGTGLFENVNLNTHNYVAYVWAEIDGFSKFNSYVGNGSTDGPFVYTGFRPKFILIKASSTTSNWVMHNSIVDTSNPVNDELLTNTTANENSIASNDIDFLSNGFKLRSTDSNINTSSATYIYGAFAEFPLKYANASLTERVRETIQVDYLVVAGGGGGGSFIGGGGGAGGYKELLNQTINKNSNYTITIGGGGNGAERVSGSVTQNATSGSSSSAFGTSTTGGGNGGSGSGTQAVSTGGSGGGGAGRGETGANGTTGEGNKGGNGSGSGTDQNTTAGGGGGANGAGGNGVSAGSAGAGGVGKQSTITGVTPTPYYAGGGGGGADSRNGSTSAANGGLGGGGNGGKSSDATNGSVNTGGGGGGGGPLDNETGGNGGSGVVIIKYPNTEPDLTLSVGIQYATSNGTVTTSITSAGQYAPSYTPTGFKVYEFRGTGGVPLNITW